MIRFDNSKWWLGIMLILLSGIVITAIIAGRLGKYTTKQTSTTNSVQVSDKQYATLKAEFRQYVMQSDPRIALEKLQQASTDSAVLNSCHDLAHEIGQQAYIKYQDFGKAAVFQSEICTAGYIHGLMQEYFSTTTDIFKQIPTLCSSYPTGSYARWECIHGIGHGLMYATQNNLPQSLENCKTFTESFDYSGCINGVYMENFAADSRLHPTRYRRIDDPFYPCQIQASNQKKDCYFTAPIYFLSLNQSYPDAFSWCTTVEMTYRTICTIGLGSQIMRRNMDMPKRAEAICSAGESWQEGPCIRGLASYYIGHFAAVEPARRFCNVLQPNHRADCQNVITDMQARL